MATEVHKAQRFPVFFFLFVFFSISNFKVPLSYLTVQHRSPSARFLPSGPALISGQLHAPVRMYHCVTLAPSHRHQKSDDHSATASIKITDTLWTLAGLFLTVHAWCSHRVSPQPLMSPASMLLTLPIMTIKSNGGKLRRTALLQDVATLWARRMEKKDLRLFAILCLGRRRDPIPALSRLLHKPIKLCWVLNAAGVGVSRSGGSLMLLERVWLKGQIDQISCWTNATRGSGSEIQLREWLPVEGC